jgi:hypothetical protein
MSDKNQHEFSSHITTFNLLPSIYGDFHLNKKISQTNAIASFVGQNKCLQRAIIEEINFEKLRNLH